MSDAGIIECLTKLIKEITVAARSGGGDPDGNPRLRSAVDAARAANMPSENIKRAIQRDTGELPGMTYEEVTYEGYAAGGVAVYLQTMTITCPFWDSGEFIATSYILGIPHSPGTPLYVLVGRVFTMLPLPLSIAERVNLLSMVFSALASMMVYLIVTATARFMYPALKGGMGRFMVHAGGLTGAFYLAFSTTFWWDATEAEVYALSSFVMGLCTWLALSWYRNPAGHAAGVGGGKAVEVEEVQERRHARGERLLAV